MNRKILGRLLERLGVRNIGFAEDGVDAVANVTQQAHINYYNILFLDNTMPNMVSHVLLQSYILIVLVSVYHHSLYGYL